MVDEESRLVRKYISKSILDSHVAIKGCWLIMFTAGTVTALQTINQVFRCKGFLQSSLTANCSYPEPLSHYCISFLIFFLTFSRFYLGDVRIFDIRYSEIFEIVNEAIDKTHASEDLFTNLIKDSDNNIFKFEVIWLMFQTLLVVFFAYQIDSTINFLLIYIVLLIMNSWWIPTMDWVEETTSNQRINLIFPFSKEEESWLEARFPSIAGRIWFINNIIHAAMLTFTCYWGDDYFGSNFKLLIGLTLCLSNCVFDFLLTKNFYFLKFDAFYQRSRVANREKKGKVT